MERNFNQIVVTVVCCCVIRVLYERQCKRTSTVDFVGPCPPCPQMIAVRCYCGKRPPKPQRCSNKEWSCEATCNKLLACGKHKCAQSCHPNECLPCPKKSVQKCLCGARQKLQDCSLAVWQCDKVKYLLLRCTMLARYNFRNPINIHFLVSVEILSANIIVRSENFLS